MIFDLDENERPDWWVFGAPGDPAQRLERVLPEPPPWRNFDDATRAARGERFIPRREEIDMVNAALYLRRPLLITGKPGVGKTSLVYAVAQDLDLGEVLRWSITTSTTLKDGLYRYDAIARLQEASLGQIQARNPAGAAGRDREPPPIGQFLRLGPLGTAFAQSLAKRPRVLLIDEIDKSDIDLPNNLLHIFEEGEFAIPELERLPERQVRILPHDAPEGAVPDADGLPIDRGRVRCRGFPLVIMTSNAEREFPPAFLRRCLKLDMALPDFDTLKRIVALHLPAARAGVADQTLEQRIDELIEAFLLRRDGPPPRDLAADQLLNAVYMVLGDPTRNRRELIEALWRPLTG
jgi:MoxR-like ATPase